ncbi:hypothetical protein AB0I99_27345 [Streptomyces spongiicola]|uniref:hypothetical protein n=1 Tax=Streptomyces spongiicola TaxID=1690221 RepID=UPI0033F0C452
MNLNSNQLGFILLGWCAIVLTVISTGVAAMHPDESAREEAWLVVPVFIPAWVAIGVFTVLYNKMEETSKREREIRRRVRRELGQPGSYSSLHITRSEMRRLLAENYDALTIPGRAGNDPVARPAAPSPSGRSVLTIVTEIAGIISMFLALLAFWFTP